MTTTDAEPRPIHRSRVVLTVAGVLAAGGAGLFSAFLAVIFWWDLCGGEAGEPYAEPGSSLDRFCGSDGSDVVGWALFLVPTALALGLAGRGVVVRRWSWVVAAALVPGVLAAIATMLLYAIPG